ncbi:MAG: hypothetical protein BA861_07260 [Desulfobacterales bacterium S3730MH5]|nr:MAG: hypothetical protein BA861_07260 [Desulfobacterales bacterium S3730MH5]
MRVNFIHPSSSGDKSQSFRFHIPTNLPAIADLLGYARSVHDRRGRRVRNMALGNVVAKPAFFTRISGIQFQSVP